MIAAIVVLLFATAGADRVGTWFFLTVWTPIAVLLVLISPILSRRYRRWAAEALTSHRQLFLGVASGVGGMVAVALAVLIGTVDTTAWQILNTAGQVMELFAVPTFTWMVTLGVVAWVFLGCVVHALARRKPLREIAATVTVNATLLLPPALMAVAYQMWRLVDVNIASGT